MRAEVAVSSGAAHLGMLDSCPVARLEAAGPWVARAVEAYRVQRRLGITPHPCPPRLLQALLVLDEEAAALRRVEEERDKLARGA